MREPLNNLVKEFIFFLCSRFEDALRDLQEGSVITMSGKNTIRVNQQAR